MRVIQWRGTPHWARQHGIWLGILFQLWLGVCGGIRGVRTAHSDPLSWRCLLDHPRRQNSSKVTLLLHHHLAFARHPIRIHYPQAGVSPMFGSWHTLLICGSYCLATNTGHILDSREIWMDIKGCLIKVSSAWPILLEEVSRMVRLVRMRGQMEGEGQGHSSTDEVVWQVCHQLLHLQHFYRVKNFKPLKNGHWEVYNSEIPEHWQLPEFSHYYFGS